MCQVSMMRNESSLSLGFHKIGAPVCCGRANGRTDERSGAVPRPAFAFGDASNKGATIFGREVIDHRFNPKEG